jgi:hypothetical protein
MVRTCGRKINQGSLTYKGIFVVRVRRHWQGRLWGVLLGPEVRLGTTCPQERHTVAREPAKREVWE